MRGKGKIQNVINMICKGEREGEDCICICILCRICICILCSKGGSEREGEDRNI